jgi:hypothetical protein
MRIVAVALAVVIASCFDKPARPGGDGGSCTGTPLVTFDGSGSAMACGTGGTASGSGGGYLLDDSAHDLEAGAGSGDGYAMCSWPVTTGHTYWVTVKRPAAYATTLISLADSTTSCELDLNQPGTAQVAFNGNAGTPVSVSLASPIGLRLRPGGPGVIEGDFADASGNWMNVGSCDYGVVPQLAALVAGIEFSAGMSTSSDTALISEVSTCQ